MKVTLTFCILSLAFLAIFSVESAGKKDSLQNVRNKRTLHHKADTRKAVNKRKLKKSMKKNALANANAKDFTFNVVPNNFVAAVPQWGPYFAISFTVNFEELPKNAGDIKQVAQFFSADQRFSESELGKLIPEITIVNVDGDSTLRVSMQLTDKEEEINKFDFSGIETNKDYEVLITQKLSDPSDPKSVKFSVEVNGIGPQSEILQKTPVIYNTLGVFVCNSKVGNSANASVTFLKFYNIQEDKKIKPSVYGVAPSWSKDYALSLQSKLNSLPDNRGELLNLISLVGTASSSSSDEDLYNVDQDLSLGSSESILPSLSVLNDKDNGDPYWCFMLQHTSTIPQTHDDCDLTNEDNGSNQPSKSKEHSITFFQDKGKVTAAVDGIKLINPNNNDDNFVNSVYTDTLKNVKIGLSQNLGSVGREGKASRDFLDGLIGAITPAIGDLAHLGISAAIGSII